MRSKETPRKVGVQAERELNRKMWGGSLAWWGSTEKKEAPHLLGLRAIHQYSDQHFKRIRASCVASTAAGADGEEEQIARSSA